MIDAWTYVAIWIYEHPLVTVPLAIICVVFLIMEKLTR